MPLWLYIYWIIFITNKTHSGTNRLLKEQNQKLPCSSFSRGSHIYVTCRSVCDWYQNEIKWLTFLLVADQGIKMNSEQLIPIGQHTLADTKEAWLHFCPLNLCKIKQSRAERSNPSIQDDYHRSSFLILVTNISMGNIYMQVTTPCFSFRWVSLKLHDCCDGFTQSSSILCWAVHDPNTFS